MVQLVGGEICMYWTAAWKMYNIKLMLSVPMSYWEEAALIKNIAKGKTFLVHTTKAEIFIYSTKL